MFLIFIVLKSPVIKYSGTFLFSNSKPEQAFGKPAEWPARIVRRAFCSQRVEKTTLLLSPTC